MIFHPFGTAKTMRRSYSKAKAFFWLCQCQQAFLNRSPGERFFLCKKAAPAYLAGAAVGMRYVYALAAHMPCV